MSRKNFHIDSIRKIYFIGIGGIGMSALARYFNQRKVQVSGYDAQKTELTDQLESEGIQVHFDQNISKIPEGVELFVYTPAIKKETNKELQFVIEQEWPCLKRAELLGEITKGKKTIAVAGSHGKTTVSAMIAHLLKVGGIDCTAFLGGIALNFKSNFVRGNDELFVVEADEYDRSFLHLQPTISVITSTDNDHVKIYSSREELLEAFNQFANQTSECLIIHQNSEIQENPSLKTTRYALQTEAEIELNCETVRVKNGSYAYNLQTRNETYALQLKMGGDHNVENTIPAIATAEYLGVGKQEIEEGVATFKGIKRRFEYRINSPDAVLIDDYAHHPEELKRLIESTKRLHPGKKVSIVFQPHLYSRTERFFKEFAQSLSLADEAFLIEIYPARERARPGVSSHLIVNLLSNSNGKVHTLKELTAAMKFEEIEVLLIAGAGNIDSVVMDIEAKWKSHLTKKINQMI